MFTGIVEMTSKVIEVEKRGETRKLQIQTKSFDLELGESLAVNGACLTAVSLAPDRSAIFEVSQETLEKTNLGRLQAGSTVNLERALLPTTRLSGHWVQGHVDGTGELVQIQPLEKGFHELQVKIDRSFSKYCVEKGSITIDGVSLTINRMRESESSTVLDFTIVPHTWSNTCFHLLKQNDLLNIELDVLAKYTEKLCRPYLKSSNT